MDPLALKRCAPPPPSRTSLALALCVVGALACEQPEPFAPNVEALRQKLVSCEVGPLIYPPCLCADVQSEPCVAAFEREIPGYVTSQREEDCVLSLACRDGVVGADAAVAACVRIDESEGGGDSDARAACLTACGDAYVDDGCADPVPCTLDEADACVAALEACAEDCPAS